MSADPTGANPSPEAGGAAPDPHRGRWRGGRRRGRGAAPSAGVLARADAGDRGQHAGRLLDHGDVDPRPDHRHRRLDADQRAAAAERKGPRSRRRRPLRTAAERRGRPEPRRRKAAQGAAAAGAGALHRRSAGRAAGDRKGARGPCDPGTVGPRQPRHPRTGDEDPQRRQRRALDVGGRGEHQPRTAGRPHRLAPGGGQRSRGETARQPPQARAAAFQPAEARAGWRQSDARPQLHPAAAGGAAVPGGARARAPATAGGC